VSFDPSSEILTLRTGPANDITRPLILKTVGDGDRVGVGEAVGDGDAGGDGDADGEPDDEGAGVADGDADGDGDAVGDEDGDGDSDGGSSDAGKEGDEEAVGGDCDGVVVSTVNEVTTTMVRIRVVIAANAIRLHFTFRRCLLSCFACSSMTREPSCHFSLPGLMPINGVPSARQNANSASA
jgi:hypothetical protein